MGTYYYKPHNALKKAEQRRRLFAIILLWTMVIGYYCIICAFSERSAAESTKESNVIVEKVVKVVKTVRKTEGENHKIFSEVEFAVRKMAHFLNFFIFGFLCIMLSAVLCGKRITARGAAAALICGLLGAAIDEWHQFYVPGRSAEVRDVCVDFAGVSIGCLTFVAALYFALRKVSAKSRKTM